MMTAFMTSSRERVRHCAMLDLHHAAALLLEALQATMGLSWGESQSCSNGQLVSPESNKRSVLLS